MKKKYLLISLVLLANTLISQIYVNLDAASKIVRSKNEGDTFWFDMFTDKKISGSYLDIQFEIAHITAGAASSDYSIITPTPVRIEIGDSVVRVKVKALSDGIGETDDTFDFKIYQVPTGYAIGIDQQVRFIIKANGTVIVPLPNRPSYSINAVRGNNTNEIADSVGKLCKLSGVIYGQNKQNTVGYNFAMCDGTGCIGIFSTKDFKSGSSKLTLAEGDSVAIYGKIEHNNRLSQINFESKTAGDTIVRLATGKTLKSPITVSVLDEESESKLVKLTNLKLISGAWKKGDTTLVMKDTVNDRDFNIRILNSTDQISATPKIVSGKKYNIIGIGSQFDNAAVANNNGYQLIPRKGTDIVEIASGGGGGGGVGIKMNPSDAIELAIFPVPIDKSSAIVYFEYLKNETAMLTILEDVQGRKMNSSEIKVKPGLNQIRLDHLDKIQNGNYFLQIESNGIRSSKQFIIQH